MNKQAEAVLTLLLQQYTERHNGRRPQEIVLTPLALLALALKQSVAPTWQSVPVVCREIAESEATSDLAKSRALGVFVLPEDREGRIVGCDLK